MVISSPVMFLSYLCLISTNYCAAGLSTHKWKQFGRADSSNAVIHCLLSKEPAVHGTRSSSTVNQYFPPYSGVSDSQYQPDPYRASAAYTGPPGIGAGRVKSAEEIGRGYQQPGISGYRPTAGFDGRPMYYDQSRNMAVPSNQPADTNRQRSAAERLWNNQPVGLIFYHDWLQSWRHSNLSLGLNLCLISPFIMINYNSRHLVSTNFSLW